MAQSYWQKRFELLETKRNQTANATIKSVTPAFDKAQVQIDKEINAWYGRFAKNNEITLQEAKKLLNTRELKEFRWDVEEYIKYGRQNALDQKWMKELENASARYHISRLEALKVRTQNAVEQAFGNELDALDKMAANLYTDDYYHTAYEIQKGLGLGWDVGQIDERKLKDVLTKPWTADKQTFSDRIWKSKTQLLDSLETELTQMCILGKDPQESIDYISKRMNVSKGQAGRLIMTEASYFGSVAQKDCFKELDVERYEIVATLDSKTSDICQQMDGKVFDMKDFQAGVTAPPFHTWCRSCTVPWFEDNDDGTRVARGEDGKTYQVPANMKYADWKEYFVDKTKDPADWLKIASVDDIVKAGKQVDEVRKAIKLEPDMFPPSFTATKAEAKNTQALMDYVNGLENADPDVVELYSKMGKMESVTSNNIPFAVKHTKKSEVGYRYYLSSGKFSEVYISYPKLTGGNFAGQVQTTLHEQMHLMDLYLRKDVNYHGKWFSSEVDDFYNFFKAVDTDNVKMSSKVKNLFDDYNQKYKDIRQRLYDEYKVVDADLREQWLGKKISGAKYIEQVKRAEKLYEQALDYECRNTFRGVNSLQDIYDALSGGNFQNKRIVTYGHGTSYYRSIEKRCHETLANYGALSITRPDLIDLLREDYPEMVDMLDKMVKDMLDKVGD